MRWRQHPLRRLEALALFPVLISEQGRGHTTVCRVLIVCLHSHRSSHITSKKKKKKRDEYYKAAARGCRDVCAFVSLSLNVSSL